MAERPNSLRGRIMEYFDRNPGEYLTMDDVAQKFNCTRQQAAWAVAFLRQTGGVETLHVVAKAHAEVER